MELTDGTVAWAAFAIIVVAMLAVDLGVASRRSAATETTLRSAVGWSILWISIGLGFSLLVRKVYGGDAAFTYLTAYLLEKSLSVDNIFVFVIIFRQLRIPAEQQRRVLYWGILGALVTRAALIAAGVFLLQHFEWLIYPFAVLIILAAVRMIWGREQERELVEKSCAVCGSWVARMVPISPVMQGGRFLVREGGRLVATPLLVALIVVETTDIVFALDSIPAVLAVTREPFLVYTSNIFAMLGLRSLYFVLADVIERFRYVRFGLAAILIFVGGKMLLTNVVELSTGVSLAVIVVALGASVLASVLAGAREARGSA
jgi:tellurite resistance protein TerC